MKYTISVGDVYETFEETPEEIAELLMRKPESIELQEETQIIDIDKLIEDIYHKLFPYNVPKETIKRVLDAESKYIEKKGIVDVNEVVDKVVDKMEDKIIRATSGI